MLYGKHEPAGPCPECGQETTGTISEGGCRWALCPDCSNELIEEGRRELETGEGY